MTDYFAEPPSDINRALEELKALNAIATAINALMAVDEITRRIIDHCLKKVGASQGSVFLLDEIAAPQERMKTFVRQFSSGDKQVPFHLNQGLTGWMLKFQRVLMGNNPQQDKALAWLGLDKAGIKSILAAPLITRGKMIGTLVLFDKTDPGGFTHEDARFIEIVGTQTATVIENARLFEREKKLAAIEEELKTAQSIQKGFLPQMGLNRERFQVYGLNVPAKEMGGDFFDIVDLQEKGIFISLGDVSGKGMPAALLMANAQAILRSGLFRADRIDLADMADRLNQLMSHFCSAGQFLTAVFGRYMPDTGILEYINAGHPAPIVVGGGGALRYLPESDVVIGIIPGYRYQLRRIELCPGEILCLYSDGVPECFNQAGEQYGENRLGDFLKKAGTDSPELLMNKMIEELSTFRCTAEPSDDITILTLKIN